MSITVLVVDDSAFMRQLIKKILETDPEIKVVGVASNGEDALKKVDFYNPQVITLDLEMPQMDGLTCLKRLMMEDPRPVVIISSWAKEGAEETLKALELGAVDFITKPGITSPEDFWELKDEIIQKVKNASLAHPERANVITQKKSSTQIIKVRKAASAHLKTNNPKVVCIGASTGGPRALQYILTHLPADFPLPILIAQHMPEDFIGIFAARLNNLVPIEIKVAEEGDLLVPGRVLIAPSALQTSLVKKGNEVQIKLTKESTIYRPSIDHLFFSVGKVFKGDAISVLLTGMGADGAKGLKELRSLGARTIAEAEETCVIYGMPRVAVEMEAVEYIYPLDRIPGLLCSLVNQGTISS
ncbi:MAG TPA: chemotaxis response regulator protein-glutamate methylesterase [Firmicutes bacterium]|nr:chemotaxis response regulator protein-glutamate methylesterase [Bacillota bacterium]